MKSRSHWNLMQTKLNLRRRVTNFVKGVGNKRVIDVVPEHVEQYLASRNVSPITKDADRRAVSSFFVWCAVIRDSPAPPMP